MGFIKILKNKQYFKGFQTKWRRRRECKTDYRQRKGLVIPDQDRCNAPKYRLVVRKTNTKVICQIMYTTISGDRTICSAESTELKQYGIKFGLTNYAASYATGLLIARRLLKQKGMDSAFSGVEEATGEAVAYAENPADKAPFKCIMDIGLARASKGNRVFAVMKGAIDGGLYIPHSVKCFPGYDKESKQYNATEHRDRIFGQHIVNYMTHLQEEDNEKYKTYFSEYVRQGIEPGQIEEIYEKAHEAIRANPDRITKKTTTKPVHVREGQVIKTTKAVYARPKKLTNQERKDRVKQKLQMIIEAKTNE